MKSLKKPLSLLLIGLFVSGCGKPVTDTNALTASEQPAGFEISINELPYSEIRYNSTSMSLESVGAYQIESDYEYSIFITTTYDISKCSDQDRHWLFEQGSTYDNDFNARCYIDSKQNDIDFETWNELYTEINGDVLYRVYYDAYCEARHNFSDAEITIFTNVKQEEKDKKGYPLENQYSLSCNGEYSKVSIPIQDYSEMPEDVAAVALKGINQSKAALKSLLEEYS